MKKKTRKQYHDFIRFANILINYAKSGQNKKRRWFCARILKNELGTTRPTLSVLNQKFNKLLEFVNKQNEQNKTKV